MPLLLSKDSWSTSWLAYTGKPVLYISWIWDASHQIRGDHEPDCRCEYENSCQEVSLLSKRSVVPWATQYFPIPMTRRTDILRKTKSCIKNFPFVHYSMCPCEHPSCKASYAMKKAVYQCNADKHELQKACLEEGCGFTFPESRPERFLQNKARMHTPRRVASVVVVAPYTPGQGQTGCCRREVKKSGRKDKTWRRHQQKPKNRDPSKNPMDLKMLQA